MPEKTFGDRIFIMVYSIRIRAIKLLDGIKRAGMCDTKQLNKDNLPKLSKLLIYSMTLQ